MGRLAKLKKKIKLSRSTTSLLVTVAIIIVGGIIFKAIADAESNARINY